jgi:hypothetical protein
MSPSRARRCTSVPRIARALGEAGPALLALSDTVLARDVMDRFSVGRTTAHAAVDLARASRPDRYARAA